MYISEETIEAPPELPNPESCQQKSTEITREIPKTYAPVESGRELPRLNEPVESTIELPRTNESVQLTRILIPGPIENASNQSDVVNDPNTSSKESTNVSIILCDCLL